jgi:hypothetical protein
VNEKKKFSAALCAPSFTLLALISRLRHYGRCDELHAKTFSRFAMKFKTVQAETLAAREFSVN